MKDRDEKGRFIKNNKAAARRDEEKHFLRGLMMPDEAVQQTEERVGRLKRDLKHRLPEGVEGEIVMDNICTLEKSIAKLRWYVDNKNSLMIDARGLRRGYLNADPMIKTMSGQMREQRYHMSKLSEEEDSGPTLEDVLREIEEEEEEKAKDREEE